MRMMLTAEPDQQASRHSPGSQPGSEKEETWRTRHVTVQPLSFAGFARLAAYSASDDNRMAIGGRGLDRAGIAQHELPGGGVDDRFNAGAGHMGQAGAGLIGNEAEHGRPFRAQGVGERLERGGHHAGGYDLLAHAPENVIQHLRPPQGRGDQSRLAVQFGHVGAGTAHAGHASVGVADRRGAEGEAGDAAIAPFQPGLAMPDPGADAEGIEDSAAAFREQ